MMKGDFEKGNKTLSWVFLFLTQTDHIKLRQYDEIFMN